MRLPRISPPIHVVLAALASSYCVAGQSLAWAGASATAPLTLDQAVSEALAQSPDLRHARAAEEEASWMPLEALAANLPHLTVNASHLFNAKFQVEYVPSFNTTFPEIAPYTIASLGVAWTVFDGLQGWNAYQAARKTHQASRLELDARAFLLEETVKLRFYQALGARILADVAAQNVKTLDDHLQKTREILSRGSATKFDLLRVQVQLEEASSEKVKADDDVILARKNLAVEMGMRDDDRDLSGELPVPDEVHIPAGLRLDLDNRADIQALDRRSDAAEKSYLSSLGGWVPKLTLTGEKDYYNNLDSSLWGDYRDAYAVGIQLSWNILDGGASIARQREQSYRGEEAEALADSAALQAPRDFENYRRSYLYNAELYRARRRAVDMAEESVRLARLGYGAGTRTSTDVLDAELDLIRARAGVVQAQVDGAESLTRLELTLGQRLE